MMRCWRTSSCRSFQRCLESHTSSKASTRCLPAHLLGRHAYALPLVHRYFDFDTGGTFRLSAWPDYVDAFHHLFSASVRNRLRSATPVAITVSGGLDSAYIFCVAQALLRECGGALSGVSGFNYAGPGGIAFGRERVRCRTRNRRVARRSPDPERLGSCRSLPTTCGARRVTDGRGAGLPGACRAASGCAPRRRAIAHRSTGVNQMLFDSDYLLDLLRSGRWRALESTPARLGTLRASTRGPVRRDPWPHASCRRHSRWRFEPRP